MTLIQFANACAIAITFARWWRRSEATAVPYGANFFVCFLRPRFDAERSIDSTSDSFKRILTSVDRIKMSRRIYSV